ncbi:MAG TPA: LCP family protein [Candidatus Woesebacteria bacterium]|nr:LCP family protein [Candidatus Woesebacteria bacterium]HNS94919.1 LCP family protein [Candidatus Woesebacteria bacterium]
MTHVPPRKLAFKSRRKPVHDTRLIVSIIIACVGLIVAWYASAQYLQVKRDIDNLSYTGILQPTPTPYYQNIALLGYGGGDHDGGALTDTIMVARIDNRAKKVFLISIPRDTWIELPLFAQGETDGHKINAAYALGLDDSWYSNKPSPYQSNNGGGGNLAKYALEQVMGEPIDHFVAVSFAAFTQFVDTLGGITITRQTSFTDYWYPTEGKETDDCGKSEEEIAQVESTLSGYLREREFPCRYEVLQFDVGTHALDGQTALKYVRSRHSETEGGDFYRSQRQREVIRAIQQKVLTISAIPKLIEYAQTMYKYVDTDFAISDTASLIQLALAKKDYAIESIALTNDNVFEEGVGPNGEYMLIPRTGEGDFTPIHRYLFDRYNGLSDASASGRFDLLLSPKTPSQ